MPANTFGYPRTSLADLDPGTYFVQGEFVPYELYERAGLPPTWLPHSCISWGSGNDGAYGKPGGTLYTDVISVTIGGDDADATVALELAHEVHDSRADSPGCAGLGPGVDSEYIKTVQIVSPSLSAFWKPVGFLQSSFSD